MNRLRLALGLMVITLRFTAVHATASADTSDSRVQIQRLVDVFQNAIVAKDSGVLRGLFLEGSSWTRVDAARAGPPTLIPGSYQEFAKYIASGKQHYEEKFSNLRIETDGSIAELYFNYIFLIDGKESNRGDETWHLANTEAGWKISALTYSVSAVAPATADARQQLLDLERAWSDAEIKHDVAAMNRILDDQFICTFGSAMPLDKQQFINAIVGENMLSQQPSEAAVVIDHDVGVIVDTFTVRGTEGGQPYTRVYRITATYVRREGHWYALAEQVASGEPPSESKDPARRSAVRREGAGA
jgi:hypothetical protein